MSSTFYGKISLLYQKRLLKNFKKFFSNLAFFEGIGKKTLEHKKIFLVFRSFLAFPYYSVTLIRFTLWHLPVDSSTVKIAPIIAGLVSAQSKRERL